MVRSDKDILGLKGGGVAVVLPQSAWLGIVGLCFGASTEVSRRKLLDSANSAEVRVGCPVGFLMLVDRPGVPPLTAGYESGGPIACL